MFNQDALNQFGDELTGFRRFSVKLLQLKFGHLKKKSIDSDDTRVRWDQPMVSNQLFKVASTIKSQVAVT